MSCPECEAETETREKQYFLRVGNANVLVFGCPTHVMELFDRYRGSLDVIA